MEFENDNNSQFGDDDYTGNSSSICTLTRQTFVCTHWEH
jgi:hypothetical protein